MCRLEVCRLQPLNLLLTSSVWDNDLIKKTMKIKSWFWSFGFIVLILGYINKTYETNKIKQFYSVNYELKNHSLTLDNDKENIQFTGSYVNRIENEPYRLFEKKNGATVEKVNVTANSYLVALHKASAEREFISSKSIYFKPTTDYSYNYAKTGELLYTNHINNINRYQLSDNNKFIAANEIKVTTTLASVQKNPMHTKGTGTPSSEDVLNAGNGAGDNAGKYNDSAGGLPSLAMTDGYSLFSVFAILYVLFIVFRNQHKRINLNNIIE